MSGKRMALCLGLCATVLGLSLLASGRRISFRCGRSYDGKRFGLTVDYCQRLVDPYGRKRMRSERHRWLVGCGGISHTSMIRSFRVDGDG